MSYNVSYPTKSISLEKFTTLMRIVGRHNASSIKYDFKQYIIECSNFNDARLIVDELGNVGMKASMID